VHWQSDALTTKLDLIRFFLFPLLIFKTFSYFTTFLIFPALASLSLNLFFQQFFVFFFRLFLSDS
jgi:hypothetical protein